MSEESKELKVYEVGFHLVPTLTEDDVKNHVDFVKEIIKKQKGSSLISEAKPILRNLAYSISKKVKEVRTTYGKAYFGWVKFETYPDQIIEIKKELDQNEFVIRYLIITTVRENTLVGKSESQKESAFPLEDEVVDQTINELEVEDLDKTIDELVVQ